MKKLSLLLLSLVLGLTGARAQTVVGTANLTFDLGVLKDAQGNSLPDGALVQILANLSTASAIPVPVGESFTGGGSAVAVLWSGSFDSSLTGITGATTISLSNVTVYDGSSAGYNLSEGDALFVRWYPTLTSSSSTPGLVSYGQYGYTNSAGVTQDLSWLMPAAGSAVTFSFLTTEAGGTASASLAMADSAITLIPEPATTAALFALGAFGLCFAARLHRRRSEEG